MSEIVPHRFEPKVAEVYGVNAAIVFEYIRYRCLRSHNGWVELSLDNLRENYMYLSKKQVRLTLTKLIGRKGLLTRSKAPQGQPDSYRLRAGKKSSGRLHGFDTLVAEQHGVVAAIIYWNLSYWIKENWFRTAHEILRKLDPTYYRGRVSEVGEAVFQKTRWAARCATTVDEWLERHPYISRWSAFEGFSRLLAAGLLQRRHKPDREPVWFLPAKTLDRFVSNVLSNGVLENSSLKRAQSVWKGQSESGKGTVASSQHADFAPVASGNSAVDEDAIDEDVPRTCVRFYDYGDAFGLPSLAGARSGKPEGRRSGAAAPTSPSASEPELTPTEIRRDKRKLMQDIRQKLKAVSGPALPSLKKKKVKLDRFGYPVKRR